jgi:hypothetical protein
MQTKKGHGRLAVVTEQTKNPRSYRVNVEGREYVRNRRHLMKVKEHVPRVAAPKEFERFPEEPTSTEDSEPAAEPPPAQPPQPQIPYMTRSGRISRRPSRYVEEC